MEDLPPPPGQLPPLPHAPLEAPWPPEIHTAHMQLVSSFDSSRRALNLDESDPVRLRFHLDRAVTVMVSIVDSLAAQEHPHLPINHINSLAHSVATLVIYLRNTLDGSEIREHAKVSRLNVVNLTPTSGRGRPRKVISMVYLRNALGAGRNIPGTRLAKALGVHRNTLSKYSNLYDIKRPQFSSVSDVELDKVVKDYKSRHPSTGIRYVRGYLLCHKIRVQKQRVVDSIGRVDGLNKVLRKHATIKRREYFSARPNTLWHVDGHHKLILWGIVIHGIADGFDRTMTALKPSTNNKPMTVLKLFLEAIKDYGCPSRIRGDRGGENMDLAIWMIMYRGANRASFMWGSSTHNTRIERMWVEIGRHFGRAWRGFFTRLGRLHNLDRHDPEHLWLLQVLFLQDIENDCDQFREHWNSHPISDKGHDFCPNDLRLLGLTEHGVVDPSDNLTPHELHDYYGVTSSTPFRRPGESGAGHDASDDEDDELVTERRQARQIGAGLERQVRHAPIDVTNNSCPFLEGQELELFVNAVELMKAQKITPAGFGLEKAYYPIETFTTGRSRKGISVPLPYEIWNPRVLLWCQALDVLKRFPMIVRGE